MGNRNKALVQLQSSLGGSIRKDKGVWELKPDKEIAVGTVRYIRFNKCMETLIFDLRTQNSIELALSHNSADMLYCLYSLKGDYLLQIRGSENYIGLQALQSALVYSKAKAANKLVIDPEQRLILTLIGINRQKYQSEFKGDFRGLDGKLKKLFNLVQESDNNFHQGNHNLKIGEYVKSLLRANHEYAISSYLYCEGFCNLVLATQIEQFYRGLQQDQNPTSLNQQEMKAVREISEYIQNYPDVEHSIKSLCRKSGLSPNKLQEGFKFMHSRTVSDFIRHTRLEKAEQLIKFTDLNISEVVYSIGLTSRSYFCKIFKKKYKYSPKQYKNLANESILKQQKERA